MSTDVLKCKVQFKTSTGWSNFSRINTILVNTSVPYPLEKPTIEHSNGLLKFTPNLNKNNSIVVSSYGVHAQVKTASGMWVDIDRYCKIESKSCIMTMYSLQLSFKFNDEVQFRFRQKYSLGHSAWTSASVRVASFPRAMFPPIVTAKNPKYVWLQCDSMPAPRSGNAKILGYQVQLLKSTNTSDILQEKNTTSRGV